MVALAARRDETPAPSQATRGSLRVDPGRFTAFANPVILGDAVNEYDEDPDFPSGEWRGFYQSGGCNHRQELRLEFSAGRIRGDGIDSIGEFVISGSYDAGSREAWWTKRYLGGHNVYYKGFREIKGIWGTWEIPPYDRDGFHIWPRAQGESLAETRRAENELPVEVLVSAGPSVDKTRLA